MVEGGLGAINSLALLDCLAQTYPGRRELSDGEAKKHRCLRWGAVYRHKNCPLQCDELIGGSWGCGWGTDSICYGGGKEVQKED